MVRTVKCGNMMMSVKGGFNHGVNHGVTVSHLRP